MEVKALYESVTNTIIEEMEAGAVPWVKPWKTQRKRPTLRIGLPTSFIQSGRN